MKKFIITADDYGMCPEVNSAIEQLAEKGILSTTNVLTNFQNDFSDSPLRKYKNSGKVLLSVEDCKEVHRLLKETNMSLRSIAKQFGVAHNLIILINSGKSARYRFDNEKYPLRKPF